METTDVLIAGAGPVGLLAAQALARCGLQVTLADPAPIERAADPQDDGREIALNARSIRILRAAGVWARIAPSEQSPLRAAHVFDRGSTPPLRFVPPSGCTQLGVLVPNHALRRAAWAQMVQVPGIHLLFGARVSDLQQQGDALEATLQEPPAAPGAPGAKDTIRARLVVAADGRLSATRRLMGIGAHQHDFGKSMLVCRMQHERAHHATAWEWFGREQTLAVLPLQPGVSSIVLTLAPHEIARIQHLPQAAFEQDIVRRLEGRLGGMRLVSDRHAYPLLGVYARRFVAERFALVGDAAVGMHPVTAHGMNYGILGVELLARAVQRALALGADMGAVALLADYERELRLATRPLYLATQAIVGLYTAEHPAALLLRHLGLRGGRTFSPLRRAVASGLCDAGDPLPLRLLAPLQRLFAAPAPTKT